eukprot:2690661-Rhodomonas_salina.1
MITHGTELAYGARGYAVLSGRMVLGTELAYGARGYAVLSGRMVLQGSQPFGQYFPYVTDPNDPSYPRAKVLLYAATAATVHVPQPATAALG